MVFVCWLRIVGCLPFAVCGLRCAARVLVLIFGCSIVVVRCALCVARRCISLFVIMRSVVIGFCSLFDRCLRRVAC